MGDDNSFNLGSFSFTDGLSASGNPTPAPTDSGSWAGAVQSAIALGGNYLSKRLDIDLASRLAGNQPMPYRMGNQNMIPVGVNGADLTSRGVQAVGGIRMGDLLPFLGIGLVLWLVMGKR